MSDDKACHTGGCACGAIRYRIDEAPLASGICHCRTCRKVASATTLPFVTFPVRTLVYEQGKPSAFASSKGVMRTSADHAAPRSAIRTMLTPIW